MKARTVVHASPACWPGQGHAQAALRAANGAIEPMLGKLSNPHVQLAPRSFGVLTEEVADTLRAAFPNTRFRLHANVRVLPDHRVADSSGYRRQTA